AKVLELLPRLDSERVEVMRQRRAADRFARTRLRRVLAFGAGLAAGPGVIGDTDLLIGGALRLEARARVVAGPVGTAAGRGCAERHQQCNRLLRAHDRLSRPSRVRAPAVACSG